MMIVIREQKPRRNGSPKKLNFSDYLPNLKVKSKFMASSDGENIQGEHCSRGGHYKMEKGLDRGHYYSWTALF